MTHDKQTPLAPGNGSEGAGFRTYQPKIRIFFVAEKSGAGAPLTFGPFLAIQLLLPNTTVRVSQHTVPSPSRLTDERFRDRR